MSAKYHTSFSYGSRQQGNLYLEKKRPVVIVGRLKGPSQNQKESHADDVLAFHRVHGDNEKTLQDARTSSTSWTGRTFVVICACVMEGGGGALGGPGGAGWA